MTVSVSINQGFLQRLLRRRGSKAYQKIEERTRRVARYAETGAPGHMGEYVTWEVTEGPHGLEGTVSCNHPAVFYVLDGTRPHIIRPRHKKALHFYVGGDEVFAARVRHPGTKPNDFMGRALRLGR